MNSAVYTRKIYRFFLYLRINRGKMLKFSETNLLSRFELIFMNNFAFFSRKVVPKLKRLDVYYYGIIVV